MYLLTVSQSKMEKWLLAGDAVETGDDGRSSAERASMDEPQEPCLTSAQLLQSRGAAVIQVAWADYYRQENWKLKQDCDALTAEARRAKLAKVNLTKLVQFAKAEAQRRAEGPQGPELAVDTDPSETELDSGRRATESGSEHLREAVMGARQAANGLDVDVDANRFALSPRKQRPKQTAGQARSACRRLLREGVSALEASDAKAAKAALLQALWLADSCGSQGGLLRGGACANLALVFALDAEYEDALRLARQALRHYRREGARQLECQTLANGVFFAWQVRRLDEALGMALRLKLTSESQGERRMARRWVQRIADCIAAGVDDDGDAIGADVGALAALEVPEWRARRRGSTESSATAESFPEPMLSPATPFSPEDHHDVVVEEDIQERPRRKSLERGRSSAGVRAAAKEAALLDVRRRANSDDGDALLGDTACVTTASEGKIRAFLDRDPFFTQGVGPVR